MIFYIPIVLAHILSSLTRDVYVKPFILICLLSYLFFLSAFKYYVGSDYVNYQGFYEQIISGTGIRTPTNYGYVLVNKLAHLLFDNYQGVHVIVSAINVLALSLYIFKCRLNYYSQLFLILFFFIIASFGYLRQGCALSFILLFEVFRNSKIKYFFFILSLSFHISAIIYWYVNLLIFYFDNNSQQFKVRSKTRMLIAIIGSVGCIYIALPYWEYYQAIEDKSAGGMSRQIAYLSPIISLWLLKLFNGKLNLPLSFTIFGLLISSYFLPTITDRTNVIFLHFYANSVAITLSSKVVQKKFLVMVLYVNLIFVFMLWLTFSAFAQVMWLNYKIFEW